MRISMLASAVALGLAHNGSATTARRIYNQRGPGVRDYRKQRPSRHMPHQGKREIARRLRQAARAAQ